MNYYYVSNKKPTKKQTKLAEAAQEKSKKHDEEYEKKMKALKDTKITGGVLT